MAVLQRRQQKQLAPTSEKSNESATKRVEVTSPQASTTIADSTSRILGLQQTMGNRFVVNLLARKVNSAYAEIQRKKHKHHEDIDPVDLFFGGNNGPAIEHRPQDTVGSANTPSGQPSDVPAVSPMATFMQQMKAAEKTALARGEKPTDIHEKFKTWGLASGTSDTEATPGVDKGIPKSTTASVAAPVATVIAPENATPDAVQQKLNSLRHLKTKKELRTVIKGKVGNSRDIEYTDEDHDLLLHGIADARAMIAAMTPKSTGLTAADIAKKQGGYFETLADLAPYYYQMANKDVIFGLSGEKAGKRKRYVYSHAAGRTCNITALSIALEGQGIGQGDFQGNLPLMQAILEAQQSESDQVKWTNDQALIDAAAKKKAEKDPKAEPARLALSAANHALHLQERQTFVGLKLKSLRFPDFMQVAVVYYFLTGNDRIASKVQPMGKDPAAVLATKAKKPADFDKLVGDAQDKASDGILFAGNFQFFAGRLFGKVETHVGHLLESGVKPLTALMNGTAPEKAQFADLLTTYKSQIDALEQVRQHDHDEKEKKYNQKKQKKPFPPYLPLSADKAVYAVLDAQQTTYAKAREKDKEGKPLIKNSLAMLKNTPKGKIVYQEQVKAYKEKALKTLPPLIRSGKTIEISRPGHFMYLAGVNDAGLVIKDVGSTGRKHEQVIWELAYDEGLLNTYISYERNDDATKILDRGQVGKGHKNEAPEEGEQPD